MLQWFQDHPPETWRKSEYQNHLTNCQQKKTLDEIKKYLHKYNIALDPQITSLSCALEKARGEAFVAEELFILSADQLPCGINPSAVLHLMRSLKIIEENPDNHSLNEGAF